MTGSAIACEPGQADDFSAWSLEAQKALYRELAADALRLWGMEAAEISWLTYSTNAVLAARTADQRYVLRLSLPGRVKESRLRSELIWLRAIRRRSDLLAPNPVPLRRGGDERLFAAVAHDLLPPPQSAYCVLFEHIDGRGKSASELSAADCQRVGRYLGRLHQDAQFEASVGFDRPRLDQPGLFGAESPYGSADEKRALAAGQRDVFARVAARVGQMMAGLDSKGAGFGLIHADLLAKNLLFKGRTIAALDFEYSAWGYFLYDLTPLLWQLRGERSGDYAQLESALLAGYQAARPEALLDRDPLEAFIAARQLASCRWLLQNRHHPQLRELAPDLIRQRTAELEQYLNSGLLERRSPTL